MTRPRERRWWLSDRGLFGFIQYRRGSLDAAVPNLTAGAALPLLGASGIMEPSVAYASDFGVTLLLKGELTHGLAMIHDADARADATGHPPTIVFSSSNVMRVGQMLGDRGLVERVAGKMSEIGERLASPRFEAYRLMCAGWLRAEDGEPDGVAIFREGTKLLERSSHLVYAPFYAALAGAALLRLGRVDEAGAMLDEAFTQLAATDARWCEPELHRLRGAIAGARAAVRRAISVAREQGARWWELRAALDLARLLPPDRREGKDALERVRELRAAIVDGSDGATRSDG